MDDYVEKRKKQIYNELDELETECYILLTNIISTRRDLEKVRTKKQAVKFAEMHDLEYGLEHIRIFQLEG